MFDHASLIMLLGLVALAAPLLLVCVLGISSLLGWKLSEAVVGKSSQAAIAIGLLASTSVLTLMLLHGTHHEPIEIGHWVVIPNLYHFSVKLVFDRLSIPFAILSFVLCGTIAGFATRYMHRERGYNRFFMLFAFFVLGMVLSSLAGTIETLFAGWELVGLSSALLVAFFQERANPSRNGFWVWTVYRFSDAALLLAAVAMHHLSGEGDFDKLMGTGFWPEGVSSVTPHQALIVGMLLLAAAAGKSALAPFSGWLPRAMEGPTPSSAVFYGALSVHLGAFMLLRFSSVLAVSPWVSGAVVALGAATALYAYLAGSVQTDIKSVVTFASLVQVGVIVAEIGVAGMVPTEIAIWIRYAALIHLMGNACLRMLQFVRAPSLLNDYNLLENAIGSHLPRSRGPLGRAPIGIRSWLYRFAFNRGYLDAILSDYFVAPFVRVFRFCDSLERRWTDFLTGSPSRESDLVKPSTEAIEDLL